MKVAYDISTLGVGYYHPHARTGVYRVIENVAQGLLDSPECDLSFCAGESFNNMVCTLDYLRANPRFQETPFIPSGMGILRKKERKSQSWGLQNFSNSPINSLKTKVTEVLKPLPRAVFSFEAVLHHLDQKGVLGKSCRSPFNTLVENVLREHDIFHSPFHPLPKQVLKSKKIQRFLTVYDLIPILFPQFFEGKKNSLVQRALEGLRREDWALCISQSTKDDLCNYLPHLDPAQVVVTPLAASEMFYPCQDEAERAAVRRKYSLPDAPYFLSLSTLEPRKNIAHTVRCFARMVQEQKIPDLNLVLVGTKGWDYDQIFDSISDVADVKNRIIATGYAADEDLAAIYSGTLGFVYPSFYEGFGLPPLEAMQCGVPVVTSNTSSLPEVVGDAGILVDPKDEEALCGAMLKLYEDAPLRRRMAQQSLERAGLFSWQKCVEQTLDAYHASLQ